MFIQADTWAGNLDALHRRAERTDGEQAEREDQRRALCQMIASETASSKRMLRNFAMLPLWS